MPVEIYFALREDAEPLTLAEVQARFVKAGLPCTVEVEDDSPELHWLVFGDESTDLVLTVHEGHVEFATIEAGLEQDSGLADQIADVLEDLGFESADAFEG